MMIGSNLRELPIRTAYSDQRDADLPWGYWMRMRPHRQHMMVEDHAGREWQSVREAFWCGRLGMSAFTTSRTMDQGCELLIAMLSVATRNTATGASEVGADAMHGNQAMAAFLESWSIASGLVIAKENNGRTSYISDEGWAVLLMLKATRPEELHGVTPGAKAVEIAGGPGLVEIANPSVDLSGARFVFERVDIVGQAGIQLVDRNGGRGRMPIHEVVWSLIMPKLECDRLFAWMCARSDRWQAWGTMTERRDANALTQHLLATYIASVDWREGEEVEVLAIADQRQVA